MDCAAEGERGWPRGRGQGQQRQQQPRERTTYLRARLELNNPSLAVSWLHPTSRRSRPRHLHFFRLAVMCDPPPPPMLCAPRFRPLASLNAAPLLARLSTSRCARALVVRGCLSAASAACRFSSLPCAAAAEEKEEGRNERRNRCSWPVSRIVLLLPHSEGRGTAEGGDTKHTSAITGGTLTTVAVEALTVVTAAARSKP